jgi:Sulfate permease and related transporters (MFS superfamily)
VSQKIPGSLIAIIVTTAIVSFDHLSVATIGDLYTIKAGLPTLTMPNLSFSLIRQMISPAFTIAILASIESLLSCVVSDGMIGSRHRSNAELVGQGVGNIMSALFGGIPATGAIARTAANIKNGGRTPIAGIVHALTLLLILLFLMPYASLIPMSCLASILVIVAYNMSGWRTFIYMLRKAPKSDIAVLLITLFLTVFFDLVVAIEFGMILAAFLFLKRMSDVATVRQWVDKDSLDNEEISEDIDLKRVPKHTVVYEIFGSLFFGATNEFLNFTHEEGKSVLILRMRNVPTMDISGLEALEETFEICKKRKMTLILSHVNEQPYNVMKKAGFIEKIGQDNICKNITTSLERANHFA